MNVFYTAIESYKTNEKKNRTNSESVKASAVISFIFVFLFENEMNTAEENLRIIR